ncbi:hypothetical protein [Lysinibacillus xylanilyticus]|uniref:hypothetical protein n=1 Tax=Lysinibacillus xylanilyticus TaxID=582475 RepID=UPI003CFF4783
MFIFYSHISNSVGSDCGGGDGAGGAGGVDMLYVLGNNALGSNDALDNDGSDNNELEKPGNMDVSHHVVLHNYHVRNRIAYLFLLSISI